MTDDPRLKALLAQREQLRKNGETVNLEVDLMARYAARLSETAAAKG